MAAQANPSDAVTLCIFAALLKASKGQANNAVSVRDLVAEGVGRKQDVNLHLYRLQEQGVLMHRGSPPRWYCPWWCKVPSDVYISAGGEPAEWDAADAAVQRADIDPAMDRLFGARNTRGKPTGRPWPQVLADPLADQDVVVELTDVERAQCGPLVVARLPYRNDTAPVVKFGVLLRDHADLLRLNKPRLLDVGSMGFFFRWPAEPAEVPRPRPPPEDVSSLVQWATHNVTCGQQYTAEAEAVLKEAQAFAQEVGAQVLMSSLTEEQLDRVMKRSMGGPAMTERFRRQRNERQELRNASRLAVREAKRKHQVELREAKRRRLVKEEDTESE
jgi:hypothetical protein